MSWVGEGEQTALPPIRRQESNTVLRKSLLQRSPRPRPCSSTPSRLPQTHRRRLLPVTGWALITGASPGQTGLSSSFSGAVRRHGIVLRVEQLVQRKCGSVPASIATCGKGNRGLIFLYIFMHILLTQTDIHQIKETVTSVFADVNFVFIKERERERE